MKFTSLSKDESWEAYMDRFVGLHGIITDPDTAINDPDALVEVSLDGKGHPSVASGLSAGHRRVICII